VLQMPLLARRIWDDSETMHGSKDRMINQTLSPVFPKTAMRSQPDRVTELKGEPQFNWTVPGATVGFTSLECKAMLEMTVWPSHQARTVSAVHHNDACLDPDPRRTSVPPPHILRDVRRPI